jgi:hypothetical protein
MTVIESNVPMPASYKNGRPASYPFRDMQVGQSIYIPASEVFPRYAAKRAYAAGRRSGMKFVCRRDEEGVRVWRVE